MTKAQFLKGGFAVLLLGFILIQFVPSEPVVIPTQLPEGERADHRVLGFEGIANFRDLGGYPTEDGRTVRWGKLYRSGTFAHASRSDLGFLTQLQLDALIDFRSAAEKEEEPNHLPDPANFEVVEIPMLDDGNNAMIGEVMDRLESGDFGDFEPNVFMERANRQLASTFTPQFREFIHRVKRAGGEPVVWHCSAGKDRTGFASAILLRVLGVSQDIVMADYMASKSHALEARSRELLMIRLFAGEEARDKMTVMMGVEESWLQAAFDTIDTEWGSFENYLHEGLALTPQDIESLRATLLH